jgi:Kef-type K+ transport system membrane component KefB
MIEVFTADLALIIVTATLLAFLARKTGQPTIIAYIVTGLLLSSGLGLVSQSEMTSLFSELGLVFLLFLIGLEMELDRIKDVFKAVTIIGVLQMSLVFTAGFLLSLGIGFGIFEAIFVGTAVMFSSTALVVKLLADQEQVSELHGKLDVGILLVQDIAVVIIMSMISSGMESFATVATRFFEVMILIGVISAISLGLSRYGLSKVLRSISENTHKLFIFGITWAFLFISLAGALNISMEIGAFVAGLGLAQLPYSFEIQERVRPLTDLFMAIFFINFGLGIIPSQLSTYLYEALAVSVALIIIKFVVFSGLIHWQRFDLKTSFLGSLNMTQTSEFSLILGALALSNGLLQEEIVGFVSLIAITTMGISSYLIKYNESIFDYCKPYLERFDRGLDQKERSKGYDVVILGYDDMAENVLDKIDDFFEDILIIDRNRENIEKLKQGSHKFIYGDIRHSKVRNEAYLDSSDIIISFIPDFDLNKQILRISGEDATRFVKAENFEEASELYDMDAHYVIVKNMLSGDKIGEQLKAYFEDREVFMEEVEEEKKHIEWRSRTWR